MYFTKKEFEKAYKGISKQISELTAQLDKIGPGKIECRRRGNRLNYVERNEKSEIGITKNFERIKELTKKELFTEELQILRKNLKVIEYCVRNFTDVSEEVVRKRIQKKHSYLPLDEIIASSRAEWNKKVYIKNPTYPENLKYITTNGVVMRSKSEREIGNALEAAGLYYQSDVKVICGDRYYYADFLIYCPDGRIVIWEHFGLEDDAEYMAKNMVKISDYINELGYRPWKDLIWTYDSDIEDSRVIREIISRFLLD